MHVYLCIHIYSLHIPPQGFLLPLCAQKSKVTRKCRIVFLCTSVEPQQLPTLWPIPYHVAIDGLICKMAVISITQNDIGIWLYGLYMLLSLSGVPCIFDCRAFVLRGPSLQETATFAVFETIRQCAVRRCRIYMGFLLWLGEHNCVFPNAGCQHCTA